MKILLQIEGERLRVMVLLFGILMVSLVPVVPGVSVGIAELAAQDVSVRAYLTSETVGVGRAFIVNVEVAGSQRVDSEPRLPDLSAFASYMGSGSSTSMQMAGNRTTVSLTIQYQYQALEEGTFQIPPIALVVGGQSFETEPLNLTVSAAPPAARQGAAQQGQVEIGPEDIFILAEASRNRVKEGEPFVVEYRIYTRVNVTSYGFTRIPEMEGFWAEEIPGQAQPQIEMLEHNGVEYTTAVIRRVALIPTGPGERTVEPLGIEAQVRVQRQRRDPFENIFNLDRSSLFGTTVPTAVLSNAIPVEVEALPPGRPEPFSGVVGSLGLLAVLSQDSVEANEAVTLTVTATGVGNLRAIPEPVLELPMDFEAYPPEVSEDIQPSEAGLRGSKSWEYVLLPRAPGARTIPALSLGYFDTGANDFRRATTGPINLVVTGDILEGPAALVRGGVETLREDIRFIHLGMNGLTSADRSPFGGTNFWLVLFLPMLSILAATALRLHRDRLEGDPAFARSRRARRVAHARLTGARKLASGETPREFYAEVALALRGFVADKLNVAEAGMQMGEAESGMRGKGVSDAVIEEVSACLNHCDLQRFAPPSGDAGEEARFLDRTTDVMTELNREVGR